MGGSHASVMPEDALDHADYVVRNEGEEALLELIRMLQSGGDPVSVQGVSLRDPSGKPVHNPDRPFDTDLSLPMDLNQLPAYRTRGLAWTVRDALANGAPRVAMPIVQATRGCPENCRFCVVKYQLGHRYRKRPLPVILSEIDHCLKRFKSPYIFFVDNDLSVDPAFSCELFGQLLDRYGPALRPYVFTKIRIAKSPELLSILQRFDHTSLGIGLESLQDATLDELKKGQTLEEIRKSIAVIQGYDVSVHGLFIFGGENDTPEVIRRTIRFCLEQRFSNVGLTPLYDFPTRRAVLDQPQLIPDHLFIHRDWRFFSGNFVVHFPRLMRPSELQQEILDGYRTFFRESRHSMVPYLPTRPSMQAYRDFLREIEGPHYGPDGVRCDKMLTGRTLEDLPRRVPVRVPPWALYQESGRFLLENAFRGVSWRMLKGGVFPERNGKGTSPAFPC